MTVALLLLTCLLLLPWVFQFLRYIATRPEAIPTPTWLVTSSVAFLYIGPLLTGIWSGEFYGGFEGAAQSIAFTSIAYWATFAIVYRLLAGASRTVLPDGPHGLRTVFGTIKAVGESVGIVPLFAFFLVLLAFRLMMLFVFRIGFSGSSDVETVMGLPYPVVVVNQLVRGASLPCTALFTMQLFGRRPALAKPLAIVGLAANLAFSLFAGRRALLYHSLLAACGLIWSGRRRGVAAIAVLALAIWFVLAVFTPIFLRARAMWIEPDSPGVFACVEIAIEQWRNDDEGMQARAEQNLAKRVSTYGFWLEMYETYRRQPLGGLVLLQAVAMVTPRLFLGMYKYSLGPSEEYLFGFKDFSNNVCLISTLDLGLPGPIVYGLIVAVMFSVMERLMAAIAGRNRYAALMAVGLMFTLVVSPEYSFGTVLRELRNLFVLAALTFAASAVVGRMPIRGAAPPPGRVAAFRPPPALPRSPETAAGVR
jgi:hypothetical protein